MEPSISIPQIKKELWWIAFGWLQGTHPAPLSFLLLNRAGGEKKVKKFMVEIRTRKSLIVTGKTFSLQKNKLIAN